MSSSYSSPFKASTSRAGHGSIKVAFLPPLTTILQDLTYQYPLKLIAPSPISVQREDSADTAFLVHTVFLLTYGGGLVAGDTIDLEVNLASQTRLCLLTQGSTKIFKTPDPANVFSGQSMLVSLAAGAVLCYLPDPVQPFRGSAFEQRQTYVFEGKRHANLCVCDWVCEGRTARNEQWLFHRYVSRNEVYHVLEGGERRLLLRDNVILDSDPSGAVRIADRVHEAGAFGTLILCGPLFAALGKFFSNEFHLLPRIGAKQWDGGRPAADPRSEDGRRAARVEQEARDGILWTVASHRGFVVVKFSANAVEGGKRWLCRMLKEDGTIEQELGERALLCLR